jgi:hypothetical protein
VATRRAPLLIFGAVFAAAFVLAALGYFSLRRWEVAAELQLHGQARDTAAMAAEKVEMAVVRAEQDAIASLQAIVAAPDFGPASVDAWRVRNPLFGAVYLCDRHGRVRYPVRWSRDEAEIIAALRGEISESLWDRGGRRRLEAHGLVILAAVIPGSSRGPLLVELRRDDQALYREVFEKTLGGTEGKGALAVLDGSGRTVFSSRPRPRRPVLTGPSGGAARLAGGPLRAGRPLPARHGAPPGHDLHGGPRAPAGRDRGRAGRDVPPGAPRIGDRRAQVGLRGQRLP